MRIYRLVLGWVLEIGNTDGEWPYAFVDRFGFGVHVCDGLSFGYHSSCGFYLLKGEQR